MDGDENRVTPVIVAVITTESNFLFLQNPSSGLVSPPPVRPLNPFGGHAGNNHALLFRYLCWRQHSRRCDQSPPASPPMFQETLIEAERSRNVLTKEAKRLPVVNQTQARSTRGHDFGRPMIAVQENPRWVLRSSRPIKRAIAARFARALHSDGNENRVTRSCYCCWIKRPAPRDCGWEDHGGGRRAAKVDAGPPRRPQGLRR